MIYEWRSRLLTSFLSFLTWKAASQIFRCFSRNLLSDRHSAVQRVFVSDRCFLSTWRRPLVLLSTLRLMGWNLVCETYRRASHSDTSRLGSCVFVPVHTWSSQWRAAHSAALSFLRTDGIQFCGKSDVLSRQDNKLTEAFSALEAHF